MEYRTTGSQELFDSGSQKSSQVVEKVPRKPNIKISQAAFDALKDEQHRAYHETRREPTYEELIDRWLAAYTYQPDQPGAGENSQRASSATPNPVIKDKRTQELHGLLDRILETTRHATVVDALEAGLRGSLGLAEFVAEEERAREATAGGRSEAGSDAGANPAPGRDLSRRRGRKSG